MRLAEESRASAWWAEYNLGPVYERLIGLEGSAATICDYQIGAIPGLLQTAQYATALSGAFTDDPGEVHKAVQVRLARQRHINKATKLKFVVDESAFRRSVGGSDVMRDQIRKLITMSGESQIELQVIPFSAGAHRGLITGFIVLQFPHSKPNSSTTGMSDVVYLEGVVDAAYLEQPDEVEAYLKAFAGLQRQALARRTTISFLEAVLRDF